MTQKTDLPWKEAIIEVLKTSGKAMHYAEIAKEIVSRKLRVNVGATPASTVAANITSSLKHDGEESPFMKVDPAIYVLRPVAAPKPGVKAPALVTTAAVEEYESAEKVAGIIRALGMYWRRELVDWTSNAALLGQQEGGTNVNFGSQRGVYLLHDGREVIYVGRTTDQNLGKRLNDHTIDRLNGRWDRFSWFGLLRVTPEGNLENQTLSGLTADDLIKTMEAILIEGLEPRQNRKRGDDLTAVEYLQVESPKLQQKKKTALLAELLAKP